MKINKFLLAISKTKGNLISNQKNFNKIIEYNNNNFFVKIFYENDRIIFQHPGGNYILIALGSLIYLESRDYFLSLIEIYEKDEKKIVEKLYNHFSLLIIDKLKKRILAITDRINTNKLLFEKNSDIIHITNSIYDLPKMKRKLDLAAVASFFVNDGLINNRTLIENISVLEGSSIHTIDQNLNISSKKYWKLQFTETIDISNTKVLREKFKSFLVKSVEENLPRYGNLYLSLSAGYDSSTILAILKYILNVDYVKTFTYKFGKVKRDGDEFLSKKIAELYNYEHIILDSFDSNLLKVVDDNTKLNNGFSNICGEINVWTNIKVNPEAENFIFVGDQFFGYLNNFKAKDIYEMLHAHLMYTIDFCPFLFELFDKDVFDKLKFVYEEDLNEFIDSIPAYSDPDKLDYIYFKYRLGNKITPWRQNFTGLKFVVLNPYLSDIIIDFMGQLHYSLRYHKRFFQETVQEMFPELFKIKRATSINLGNYWEIYLEKEKYQIIKYLSNSYSPIDELLDKEKIILMLKNYRFLFSFNNHKKFMIEYVKRGLRKLPFGEKIIKKYKTIKVFNTISEATFIKRYLVLRSFISLINK